ncbi:MAG: hypothetical protein WED04_11175 [Promethearchaeati archaeon SRVP18_Atabeyarchaeia-1]
MPIQGITLIILFMDLLQGFSAKREEVADIGRVATVARGPEIHAPNKNRPLVDCDHYGN